MKSGTEGPHPTPSRATLGTLYLRVADTLERSAELSEQHAQRLGKNGNQREAAIEVERAKRARAAAQHGRALALRLRA